MHERRARADNALRTLYIVIIIEVCPRTGRSRTTWPPHRSGDNDTAPDHLFGLCMRGRCCSLLYGGAELWILLLMGRLARSSLFCCVCGLFIECRKPTLNFAGNTHNDALPGLLPFHFLQFRSRLSEQYPINNVRFFSWKCFDFITSTQLQQNDDIDDVWMRKVSCADVKCAFLFVFNVAFVT